MTGETDPVWKEVKVYRVHLFFFIQTYPETGLFYEALSYNSEK